MARRLKNPLLLYVALSVILIVVFSFVTDIRLLQLSAIVLLLVTWAIRPLLPELLPIVLAMFAGINYFYTLGVWGINSLVPLTLFGFVAVGIAIASLWEVGALAWARVLASSLILIEGAHLTSLWSLDPISRAILITTPFALWLRLHPFEHQVSRHPRQFSVDLVVALLVIVLVSRFGTWGTF